MPANLRRNRCFGGKEKKTKRPGRDDLKFSFCDCGSSGKRLLDSPTSSDRSDIPGVTAGFGVFMGGAGLTPHWTFLLSVLRLAVTSLLLWNKISLRVQVEVTPCKESRVNHRCCEYSESQQ